jgi:hypothetical protein
VRFGDIAASTSAEAEVVAGSVFVSSPSATFRIQALCDELANQK